jgi:hypothetical protein
MLSAETAMLCGLTLFVAEGFALAAFPVQFQRWIAEADPRLLQVVGCLETLAAIALGAMIAAG